jgi:hypothetical protein
MNGEQETVVTEDEEKRNPETEETHESDAPEEDQPESGSEETGRSAIEKAMEDMGLEAEDEEPAPEAGAKPAEGNQPKEEEPAAKQPEVPAKEEKPEEQPKPAVSPEQEEAELVKAIPSERGRKRMTQLLREGREARTNLDSFRRVVSDSGLDQESFGNLLTITKLCSSANPQDLDRGLKMLEDVRTALYRQVGREAPGVDLLAGQSDLQERVKAMGISREDALAIARGRQAEADQKAQYEAARQEQAEQAAFMAKLDNFKQVTTQAFAAHQNDLDFNERIAVLQKRFTPQEIIRFAREVPPEQWGPTLMYYYDMAGDMVQRPAAQPRPNVIAGRPSRAAGARVNAKVAATPEGIAARMEELGL